jgi:hypothetical protein
MITNLNNFVNKSLGSSLSLPANGLGGSRATSSLVAHFALQNTASNSAEKKNRPREGVAEGGLGGIPPRPSRSEAPPVAGRGNNRPKSEF